MTEKNEFYVVRLDERGYYGTRSWTPVSLEEAIRFTAKKARAVKDRMTTQGYPKARVDDVREL